MIVECKKDVAHDDAVLQAVLYCERVLQAAFLNAPKSAIPLASEPATVIPMVSAHSLKRPRRKDPRVALPSAYEIVPWYWPGTSVRARISYPVISFTDFLPTGFTKALQAVVTDTMKT